MSITGTTQKAHQQLIAAIEASLPSVIAEAVETDTAPIKAEAESLRKLVNETNERAATEKKELSDTLSEKQSEILGLREEVKDARSKVATAAAEIGMLQSSYNELIMAVENKYDGETRHQTALRFIRDSQKSSEEPAKEA